MARRGALESLEAELGEAGMKAGALGGAGERGGGEVVHFIMADCPVLPQARMASAARAGLRRCGLQGLSLRALRPFGQAQDGGDLCAPDTFTVPSGGSALRPCR